MPVGDQSRSSSSRMTLGGSVANTGAQLVEHAVLALGVDRSPASSARCDAEAHERHRRADERSHRLAARRAATRSAGSSPAGSGTTRSSSLRAGGDPRGAQHRLLAGAVGVERELHDRRQPARARATCSSVSAVPMIADACCAARLVHRDDVGVALGDDRRCPPSPPARARGRRAKSWRPLWKSSLSGRVEVLRRRRSSSPSARAAEAEHPPARVGEREHDPRAEAVVDAPALLRFAAPGPAS